MSEIKSYPGLYQHVLSEALKALPSKFKMMCFESGMVGETAVSTAFAHFSPKELEKWLQRWLRSVLKQFDIVDGRRYAYSAMKTLIPYRYAIVLVDSHAEFEELLALKYAMVYVNLRKSELKVIDSTGKGVFSRIIWRLINNPPIINPGEVIER